MATATLVPLEEYLHTSYEPDREWIDGELKERSMGERPHAALQKYFMKFFILHEAQYGLEAFAELRTQVSATNYRVPDVVVVRESDPDDAIVRVAPVLCIEILSPEDRMSDMHEKIEDYLKMGVGTIWVLDPRRKSALTADYAGTRRTDILELPPTDIRFAVSEVFAAVRRRPSQD